jgi:hypothetical protein
MHVPYRRVGQVAVGVVIVLASVGFLSCSDSVTDVASNGQPTSTLSSEMEILADGSELDGMVDPSVESQAVSVCTNLALEAIRAGRAYTSAARRLANASRHSPDSEETAVAREAASAAFDELQTIHLAMAGACVPLVVDGTYDLSPTVQLTCPFIPLGFGNVEMRSMTLSMLSASEVMLTMPLYVGPILTPTEVTVVMPYDATTRTFGAASSFNVSTTNVTATGDVTLDGMFTGPDTFTGSLQLSLHLSVSYLSFDFSGDCNDVNAQFTGTRR